MTSATLALIFIVIIAAAVAVVLVLLLHSGSSSLKFDIGGQAPRAAGGNDVSPDKMFKRRLIGLGIFSGGVIGALLARPTTTRVRRSRTARARSPRSRLAGAS